MGSIYVCPKCEVEVKYSKLFCSCGTQLVRTDDALADDVFRKYRESNGIEVTKNTNEEETNTSQNFYDKVYLSQNTEKNSIKTESLNFKKNILIQTIYFFSTFWVFAGFTLSYASYISYLTLFLITLIVYIAIYKINLGNYSATIKRTTYWLLFSGVFMLVVVMEINPFIQRTLEFIGNSYKYGSCSVGRFFSSPPKLNLTSGERVTKELYDNNPKNISPIYLNRLFSEGTDLQKTNAEKSITGQIVKWKLQVKNVSFYTRYSVEILTNKGAVDNRSEKWKSFYNEVDMFFKDAGLDSSFSSGGGRYDNQNVGVNIILDLDSHDASYLNSLKEGDWIVVIGKIDDVIGDRVRLSPAVLENNFSMSLYESTKNKVNQHKVDYQKYKEGSCKFQSSGNTLKTATEKPSDDVNNSNKDSVRVNDPRVSVMKFYLSTVKTLQSFSGDINNPDRDLTIRWKGNDGAIEELDIRVFFEENNGEATASVGKWQTDYVLATYKMKFIKDRWEIIQTCNWIWSAEKNDDVLKCKVVKNGNMYN